MAEEEPVDIMECGSSGASASSGYETQKTSEALDHKEEKKERVRHCLRELHSLMPEGSQRKGLLGTLQQVVERMKQIKGEPDSLTSREQSSSVHPGPTPPIPSQVFFNSPSPHPKVVPFPNQEHLNALSGPPQHDFRVFLPEIASPESSKAHHIVVMSLNDGVVCEASEELVSTLGYPKDYWLRQSLFDFLCKQDLSIFTSKLSQCRVLTSSADAMLHGGSRNGAGQMSASKSPVDAFYFRLRHYKSLRSWYNLVRPDHFSVFHGKFSVQTLDLRVDNAESAKEFIVLECHLLNSAFKESGSLPERIAFSTKHNVFCNYCHIDDAGISLLGYLPQDIINTSIFNYYHPEDLPLILTAHQNVAAKPGESYTSPPYRMKARNGDYILLQTIWTKQGDKIVNKHVILKGPKNCNVFENESAIKEPEIPTKCLDILNMEKLIKNLLWQPNPCKVAGARPLQYLQSLQAPIKAEVTHTNASGSPKLICTESYFREAVKQRARKPEEGSGESSISLPEEDMPMIYRGLLHASIIKRYLMSHASFGSSAEFTVSTQLAQMGSTDGSLHNGNLHTVDVDLPLPARIPSQASSTRALVSELEREELTLLSHDDAVEEFHKGGAYCEQQDYTPICLSIDALKMHDKIHERSFIEEIMREKAGYLSSPKGSQMLKMTEDRYKQDHKNNDKMVSNKIMGQDGNEALFDPLPLTCPHSLIPITSIDTFSNNASASTSIPKRQTSHQSKVSLCFSCHISAPFHVYPTTSAVYPTSASIPTSVSTFQLSVAPTTAKCPDAQTSSMMHSGNIYTQHMGQANIYPPGPTMASSVNNHPANVPIATSSLLIYPFQVPKSEPLTGKDFKQKTIEQSSMTQHSPSPLVQSVASVVDLDFSTDSSLLNLIETSTDSSHPQSTEEEERHTELQLTGKQMIQRSKHSLAPTRHKEPPWKQAVNWTPDVQMRYKIPKLNSEDLLRQDSMSLKLTKQPVELTQQLNELLFYISSSEEDSDSHEDELTSVNTKNDSEEDKSLMFPEFCTQTEQKDDKATQNKEEKQQCESSELSSESSDCPHCPNLTDKLSESSESIEISRSSSDLTPSDSRSSEEVVSSIKESDNTSSSGSIKEAGSMSIESENGVENHCVNTKPSPHTSSIPETDLLPSMDHPSGQ